MVVVVSLACFVFGCVVWLCLVVWFLGFVVNLAGGVGGFVYLF